MHDQATQSSTPSSVATRTAVADASPTRPPLEACGWILRRLAIRGSRLSGQRCLYRLGMADEESRATATEVQPWKGWRDDPITTVDQDTLQRAPVARRAARLIDENHSPLSSVVYGLEGPWGSGKSSVIAMITDYLTAGKGNRWRVVPFTPWATSGTEGLLSEFFSALATVAPQSNSKTDLRRLIGSYADIARPLAALVPVAGTAIAELTRTLEGRLAKPWNVAFNEVATELRALDTPVLVVVDDIDRLQPRELLDLLKVVRLLGRFPGVDFLLAYDEQTLVETLQNPSMAGASKARARAFMEKIVQYPLSMPPLLTAQIVRLLGDGLTEMLTPERVEVGFDKHRFSDIIRSAMPSQLATPRAIERFLAQVHEQFRAHDLSEVDAVDLILATFLKIQFPDVFARLQSWKADLTRRAPSVISAGTREDTEPEWGYLVEGLDREDRRDALAVLAAIFPAVHRPSQSRVRAGRFAHPDYFDRYLAQAIPEGDIPDAIVDGAIAKASTGDGADLHALVLTEHEAKAALALAKITSRYPDVREVPYHDGPTGPVTLELLSVGMTILDDAEDRVESWSSTALQVTDWAAILLRRVLDIHPASDIDPALTVCSNVHRRAHVVSKATRDVEDLGEKTRQALYEARQREISRLLPFLLDDLRDGDQSSGQSGSSFLYEIIADSPALPELQTRVAEGLAAYDFTLEDVAARFVGLMYAVGGSGSPSSAYFSGELFTKVTGVEARSGEFREQGEWPDTSWPRLRAFAARFIMLTPDQGDRTGDGAP